MPKVLAFIAARRGNMAIAVRGPVTGGPASRPFSLPPFDVAERGYVAEEFFLSGEAWSYRPRDEGSFGVDGNWDAEHDGTAPFTSRMLVVRPADAGRFNGTAIVSWLNVTAGYELGMPEHDELYNGFAWVGVSAQRVGIHGFPPGREYTGRQIPQKPLKDWDPERYADLDHPGDRYSFDIFAAAGRAARDRIGLPVKRLIATGASQSGSRLIGYINAVHPLEKVYDAFIPTITSGSGSGLGESRRPGPADGARPRPVPRTDRWRTDLDEPIWILNTECESEGMYPARKPDTERFRFWEVAGAPHTVAAVPPDRDRGGGRIDNPLTYRIITSAVYRHMHHWLVGGTLPPVQPRIEYEPPQEGERPRIKRDEHGNAVGGIRLPELAAPIGEYHGRDDTTVGGLGALYGWFRPFPPATLKRLYLSREGYAAAYRKGVDDLAATQAIRPEDVGPLHATADDIADSLDIQGI